MEVAEVTQVSILDFGLLAISARRVGINPLTAIETLGKNACTVA
ncbi:hypothetical protein VB834_28630 [Limnoraphis robusta Tam1]|jgi:hypothetical protein|uniref:Uncharacterized protein n=1 Tax=Limnoraphis robusta CCNP1315 TaxID=3110306 RepID=A0ABU5U565_9CYAN|nr:hypothetical protein [Limnoraphis robusta]MEA5498570.1 hypothetical protein [Limnoraphis robusta BA-68 BA1]MEA5522320.1 hypothetical protein [Limnoraphis robusta CCNP1315]MEA5543003.1 hypothetical protein [Limnoraphis robusta Tam1]MEA5549111.1 hypothetical protein [Limnoraphis robusta CCNP1324]